MAAPYSSVDFPATHYPDRPYDWSAPYDWSLEGIFEDGAETSEAPRHSSTLRALRTIAAAGAIIVASQAAIMFGIYEFKKQITATDAQNVPAKLPRPVRHIADSALKVRYNWDLPIGLQGSGVKIGPNLVATAGHMVLEGNPHHRLSCSGTYTLNRSAYDYEERDIVVSSEGVYDDSTDIGVLQVENDFPLDLMPTARIAANQPQKGEPVFFINYETAGANASKSYYPNPKLAESMGGENGRTYGHPAEYAGTVVGHNGSFLLVATDEKGYGSVAGRELESHPGSSGGPVFNRYGKLIGVSVSSGSETALGVTLDHDVNLPDGMFDGVPITWVQPVTKDILQPLIDKLPAWPSCSQDYE